MFIRVLYLVQKTENKVLDPNKEYFYCLFKILKLTSFKYHMEFKQSEMSVREEKSKRRGNSNM